MVWREINEITQKQFLIESSMLQSNEENTTILNRPFKKL